MFAVALAAAVALPRTMVAQAAAQDTRPGIAVLTLDNGGSVGQARENYEGLTVGLQQTLITELSVNPALRLVDRHQIAQLMQEQDLGATGRVDAQTAAKIGKLVGAKYVVLGSFIDLNGTFRMDGRIVNVETSEILKAVKAQGKREDMFTIVGQLATEITRGVNLPALSRQAMEQHAPASAGHPSAEALTFYSRALVYADRGDKTHATEFFNRAIAAFPQYTEAKQGLASLGS
jgi:TolB-like protein